MLGLPFALQIPLLDGSSHLRSLLHPKLPMWIPFFLIHFVSFQLARLLWLKQTQEPKNKVCGIL